MSELWQNAVPLALLVLFALLSALTGLGAVYLQKRAHASKVFTVLANFWEVVRSTVAHADAELRPAIAAAFADGRLTPDEAASLKAKAIALVKAQLGTAGLEALKKSLGLNDDGLTTYLSGAIERAVAEKKTLPVVRGTPVAALGAPALASPS